MPTLITCAPPSAVIPDGCIASRVLALTAGRVAVAEYSRGAPVGAAGQGRSRQRGRPVGLIDHDDRAGPCCRRQAGIDGARHRSRVLRHVAATQARGVPRGHADRSLRGHRRDLMRGAAAERPAGAASCRTRRVPRSRRSGSPGAAPCAGQRASRHPSGRGRARRHAPCAPKSAAFAGTNVEAAVHPLQASLQFASLPPRTPSP